MQIDELNLSETECASRLSQITDGKWKTVSDYFGSTAAPAAAPKAPVKK